MRELCRLLERFWIVRNQDSTLYFDVKRALPRYRRFLSELLGWNIVVSETVIKLEKVPPRSFAWMGIADFQEPMDYCLLCALLLFLADREDGETFLLSALTEAVEAFAAESCPVDWTRYPHRKSLVRVLRFAHEMGMLIAHDGDSDGFGNSREQEVLYENTGISRYFAVHFSRDISGCQSIEDFEALSREGDDADRGAQRIHRVYRQLALSPALYWSEGDRADYEYVKNQRQWLGRNLEDALGGELQVHKNGAFLVFDEGNRFGTYYPRDLALSDVSLLFCTLLRERVLNGFFPRLEDDTVFLTRGDFRRLVSLCRDSYGNGWGRQLRALPAERLCELLAAFLCDWMLMEESGDGYLIHSAAAKLVGHYPPDYQNTEKELMENEPMEDK